MPELRPSKFGVGTQKESNVDKVEGGDKASPAQRQALNLSVERLEELGIGGLDEQFRAIFRRAFASRAAPPSVAAKLGLKHARGILLHGPPGTGKTLIARQIGKLLGGKAPKVINGPEILDKFVGESEQKIRKLFADAERDYARYGENSNLHIIIFDEIDAICRQRGSSNSSTSAMQDTIVNQLLTKIDGVSSLNNVLLIGITNRKELLDTALLRPGRLEVDVEVGLPDAAGREQILQIHTRGMREAGFVDEQTVDISRVADATKNFSGAELEGVCRSAASFALDRMLNPDRSDIKTHGVHAGGLGLPDEEDIVVSGQDFERAVGEVTPHHGAQRSQLDALRPFGMLPRGADFEALRAAAASFVGQVASGRAARVCLLLEGERGVGKSALAASLAAEADIPLVTVATPDSIASQASNSGEGVAQALSALFDTAARSKGAVVLLDDLERLVQFSPVGPAYNNAALQALFAKLEAPADTEGKGLLVLATTSQREAMEQLGLLDAFDATLTVPPLQTQNMLEVMHEMRCFNAGDAREAAALLGGEVPIKRLLQLLAHCAHRCGLSLGEMRASDKAITLCTFRSVLATLSAMGPQNSSSHGARAASA